MDEPLFGERTQKAQVLVYVVGGIVSIFVLYSLIVAIIFGIQEKEHFVIAVAMLLSYVVLIILFKWYRAGDLEPKFKYLIALVVVSVLVTAIAVNVYVWKKPPPVPPPIHCNGLYRFSDGTCFPDCSTEANTCLYYGTCMQIPTCNSTTTASRALYY